MTQKGALKLTSEHVVGTGSYEGAAFYTDGATAAVGGTAMASDADTTFWASSGDGFGSATTGHQADFTGDVYAEYCFGSPQNSDHAAASGQIYCVPGNTVSATSAYLDSLTGITRGYGSNADDYFGSSVLILDLNNDSTGEVAVGAPGSGSGGTVFLLTE